MRLALGVVWLVGCGSTPHPRIELELDGDLDRIGYHIRDQPPTAVGGTQTFHLHYKGGVPAIPGPAFDLPYTAVAADDRLKIEYSEDAVLEIRGVAPGLSAIRFLYDDGSLIDEVPLKVAEIDKIVLEPTVSERVPRDVFFHEAPLAWAPGEYTFDVEPYFGITQLGDSSMEIALAGAERTGLDELHVPSAAVGTYPISVTAGNWHTPVDFVVVDQADSVSLITGFDPAPTSLMTGRITSFCFQARNAGRYIVGLAWDIAVVGDIEPQGESDSNCVGVIPRQTSGNIIVSATAAGQTVSLTLPVVAK